MAGLLSLPKGLDLGILPGMGANKELGDMPKLLKTEIWIGNFDGPMKFGTPGGGLAVYEMRNGIYAESGCVIPGTGMFETLTGGRA